MLDNSLGKNANVHQRTGLAVEKVLRASVYKKSIDNITTVIIGLENLNKICSHKENAKSGVTSAKLSPRVTPGTSRQQSPVAREI